MHDSMVSKLLPENFEKTSGVEKKPLKVTLNDRKLRWGSI